MNENYVYFCEPIKNNIMNEGSFIRILYSTNKFVMNGIYIYVNLNHTEVARKNEYHILPRKSSKSTGESKNNGCNAISLNC